MSLDKLLQRQKDIEAALVNANNQLQNLLGARAENLYNITQAEAALAAENIPAIPDADVPVDDTVEPDADVPVV